MSRPQKKGLDYFPLDVYMDDNVELLEADCGLEGFAVLIKLYQKIYANGYYINAGEKELKLLSRRLNASINLITDVINTGLRLHLFDSRLFSEYRILTSKGIQKRYFAAVRKRVAVEYIPEYFLLNVSDYNNLVIDVNNSVSAGVSDAETPVSDTESTQRKEKKSKVKNIYITANKSPSQTEQTNTSTNVSQTKSQTDSRSLFKRIQSAFESKYGHFDNYGKEGKAIHEIIRKAKARSPDNPELLIHLMLEHFWRLKQHGKEFWRKQPFLPSTLNSSGIWTRILEEINTINLPEYDPEFEKELEEIFG